MNVLFKRFFTTVVNRKVGILAPLEKRGILCVIGRDSYDVLQGLCTNDVKKFQKDKTRVSMSTFFLDNNGRVICEAMLNKPQMYSQGKRVSKQNEIWLDCDKELLQDLVYHIQGFTSRKHIDLGDISEDVRVWSLISPYFFPDETDCGKLWKEITDEGQIGSEDEEDYADFTFADPRLPALGARIIASAENNRVEIIEDYVDKVSSQVDYDRIRMLFGVAEGKEIENMLPFTANVDFLNSINLSKDDYLGQDITSRNYTDDVIKKRIMPFIISTPNFKAEDLGISYNVSLESCDQSFKQNLSNAVIKDKAGENIGKVLTNINNVGLAIVSANKLARTGEFEGSVEDLNCIIARNEWFDVKLNNYIEDVKSRNPNAPLE